MTVDAERLVSTYLRAQAEIVVAVGDRVYTEMPASAVFPLIRLTLLGGTPLHSIPLYHDSAYLQIDVYGGPKALARGLVDTVRSLLVANAFRTRHDIGTVSNVTFGELAYVPDSTFDPPKPRYTVDVTLLTHPS